MLQRLILVLIIWLCQPAQADNTLIFGQFESPRDDPKLYQAITDIVEQLFKDSPFVLTPKVLPYGIRTIAEFQEKRIDLILTGANAALIETIPDGVIELHPLPIIDFSWAFFAKRDSGLTKEALNNLQAYSVGANRMPINMITSILGQPTGDMVFFSNYDYLSKGLQANRFDIMAGNIAMAKRAFRRVGIEDAIIELGPASAMNAHIYIRASLPSNTKKEIFAILDRRIPELKQQGVFDNILSQYDWQ